jgi:hypothetical protein
MRMKADEVQSDMGRGKHCPDRDPEGLSDVSDLSQLALRLQEDR